MVTFTPANAAAANQAHPMTSSIVRLCALVLLATARQKCCAALVVAYASALLSGQEADTSVHLDR